MLFLRTTIILSFLVSQAKGNESRYGITNNKDILNCYEQYPLILEAILDSDNDFLAQEGFANYRSSLITLSRHHSGEIKNCTQKILFAAGQSSEQDKAFIMRRLKLISKISNFDK